MKSLFTFLLLVQSVATGALVWAAVVVAGAFVTANPEMGQRPLPLLPSLLLATFRPLLQSGRTPHAVLVLVLVHAVVSVALLRRAQSEVDLVSRTVATSLSTWVATSILWAFIGSAIAMASIPVLTPIK